MKAFLLAAGLGSRLRPLTDTTPKCLVPIDGKPLLDYWMRLFEKHGVDEVFINTHYLHEQVEAYVAAHNADSKKPYLTFAYEPELLGSGGTVRKNRDFIGHDETFLICYADNLTNADLSAMIDFHRKSGSVLTMALFRADNPRECGIAALDEAGKIVEFTEKPAQPKSNLANAGIYVAEKEVFDYIPQTDFSDFGKDVLPKLTGQMNGFALSDYLLDIGTPEKYARAQEDSKRYSF